MEFDKLSPEIKYQIFSYLTDDYRHSITSLVSKDWLKISRDPNLRFKLVIFARNQAQVIQLLKKYTKIRWLIFYKITIWSWLLEMPKLNHIAVLDLYNCHFKKSSSLMKLVEFTPVLKTIFLMKCAFDINDCATPLAKCNFLRKIWIKPVVSDDKCHCTFFDKCMHIESLSIWCSCITDSLFQKLTNDQCANLKDLTLFCNNITECGYLQLSQYHKLSSLRLLETLRLTTFCLLTIKGMTHLQCLALIGSPTVEFIHLFHGALFPQLVTLHISPCKKFRKETLQLLIESCPRLKDLALNTCDRNLDDGLCEVVETCSDLVKLSLGNMHKTTGRFLKLIPTRLPNLNDICIVLLKVKTEELVQLKGRMANLRIQDYFDIGDSDNE